MNDKELEITTKVQNKLEEHGRKTTEFVRKALKSIEYIRCDSATTHGYPIYDGNQAIIVRGKDEIVFLDKRGSTAPLRQIAATETPHIFHAYESTAVTRAEKWWIDCNRRIDAETLDELVEKINADERQMENAQREIDFIVEKHNATMEYSDKAKAMFGI